MKRYLPLIMVILFPYFVPILAVLSYFLKPLGEIVFAGEGALILVCWLFTYIIALISSLLVLIISLIKKRDSIEMLRISRKLKLLHLPAHIIIFVVALISLVLGLATLTIILFFFDFGIVFLSGMLGVGGLIRGFYEKRLSMWMVIVYGIFQFIFIADIFSSNFIYWEFIYKEVKPTECL